MSIQSVCYIRFRCESVVIEINYEENCWVSAVNRICTTQVNEYVIVFIEYSIKKKIRNDKSSILNITLWMTSVQFDCVYLLSQPHRFFGAFNIDRPALWFIVDRLWIIPWLNFSWTPRCEHNNLHHVHTEIDPENDAPFRSQWLQYSNVNIKLRSKIYI